MSKAPGRRRDGGLPDAPRPMGAYQPAVVFGGIVTSAGMTPRRDGHLVSTGRVGREVSVAEARGAAALAAENALAAIAQCVGGIEQVERLIRMTVFVACDEGFTEHTAVADGASEALASRLGPRAAHARVAVGVTSLPGNAPVEIQLVAAQRTLTDRTSGA